MNLYDEIINEWEDCIKCSPVRSMQIRNVDWPDAGNDNMIFQKDMAFMLGGDRRFQTSACVVTEDPELLVKDEILLIGPDIPEIKADMPFSRLTIVRVKEGALPADDTLYSKLQKIEFTKYHVSPKGYMLRISSGNGVESVRVAKNAVENGLNFETVGNMYLQAYHQNPVVEAVKMIFITDPAFAYEDLKQKIKKASDITKTIDHIYQKVSVMDCEACNLQVICNEVEGLRELHFAQKQS